MPQNLPIFTRDGEPYLLTVQLKDTGGGDFDTAGWAARLRVMSHAGAETIIEEETPASAKLSLSTGLLAVSLLGADIEKLTPRSAMYAGEIELRPPSGEFQTAFALQWQHDAEGAPARPAQSLSPYTIEIGGVVIVATIVLISTGDGHTHENKAVLDTITDAGSGTVISTSERSKLAGIEAGADVTDTANVTTALSGAALSGLASVDAGRLLATLTDANDIGITVQLVSGQVADALRVLDSLSATKARITPDGYIYTERLYELGGYSQIESENYGSGSLGSLVANGKYFMRRSGEFFPNSMLGGHLGRSGNDWAGLYLGGCHFIGKTTSAADPTTTEFPMAHDWGFHKNTASGALFIVFNDAGSIKTLTLT